MFALVDCNNFYASCERVFRPNLNGKPVVILSNNDGCVIARSNEAKKIGIPMAAPAFQYKQLLEANNVAVFSSNYALYGDLSARVMKELSTFTPDMEIYSIDEAFLKFDGFKDVDYYQLGLDIRNRIKKFTGIPVSVGFAPTKALAKVANKIVKKFEKETGGAYVIDSDEKRLKALKWLPVQDVWGIGWRHAKRLQAIGINNAHQFIHQSDAWVRKHMSVVGLRLKRELEGISTLELEQVSVRKQIATTRSFERNYSKYEEIKERVVTFSVSCAEKLRRQKSICNAMLVFLHTNSNRDDLTQYSRNIVVKLPFPTSSSIELAKFAEMGLQKIFKPGYQYKKAGVIIIDIIPEDHYQLSLFENSDPRHKKLMKSMDKINATIGNKKLKLGSQDLERTWKMRQEKLSPRYTTRLDEIINIKV